MRRRSICVFLVVLTVLGPYWGTSVADPEDKRPKLTGTVLSKSGDPKAFVRVEIDSPDNTLFTRKDGTFEKALAVGEYTIKIIEGRRSTVFKVTIEKEGLEKEFKLGW